MTTRDVWGVFGAFMGGALLGLGTIIIRVPFWVAFGGFSLIIAMSIVAMVHRRFGRWLFGVKGESSAVRQP
jgi:hypothetical protein